MRFQTVMTRVAAVVLLVFACTRCSEGASTVPTTGPGTGVLFVGNSLTYTNDVPGLVAGLANAVGHPGATLFARSRAYILGAPGQFGFAVAAIEIHAPLSPIFVPGMWCPITGAAIAGRKNGEENIILQRVLHHWIKIPPQV